MSERYGSPGELKEAFESLEDWLCDEMNELEAQSDKVARYAAFREVRDFILGNEP